MAICPHCGSTINAEKDVRIKRLTQVKDIEVVSCAVCDKVLGIE
jgi:RNase P subunit RPR2